MKEMKEFYSAKILKKAIKNTLKSYGRILHDRFKLKSTLILIGSGRQEEIAACERALRTAGSLLKRMQEIISLKLLFSKYLSDIINLQRKWRGLTALKITRQQILKKKWDQTLDRLITKAKKQEQLKLKAIPNSATKNTISSYYEGQKKKYYRQLEKLFENRREKNISQLVKAFPSFKYIPTEQTMSKLILDLI
eukprot:TRINITY_DN8414_c0_g1_i3.p1 TRINITY_DN8414_c0_g1~~TRINITY_DN8414_c0_g1_i3.p1  ORF type:complete len:194 (+),score=32.05 TRINITY_DN8414_c0_g1_i3:363-944(+)